MLPLFLRNLLPSGGADHDAAQQGSTPRRSLSRTNTTEYRPQTEPLPPYLTSRPLLCLTLLSPPILALLLALFTLTLLATQATGSVAAAKREILAGCTAAERASRVLDHVPALMREQGEKAIKKAVEGGVSGVGVVLMLAITIIQEVLKFLVDTFRSTYMCCLELVIFGALAILIGAIKEISDAVSATLRGIRSLIQSEVSAANSVVQTAVKGINKVTSVFGISALSIDEFDVPALSKLQNVTIGSRLEDELRKLNNSLPTLDDVREKLDTFIDEPFDLMTTKINATTSNFTFEPSSTGFNATATSLAALSTSDSAAPSLCADLDLSFVDDLGRDLQRIKSWGIGLLVVAILIAIGILLYLETRRYRALLERIRLCRASQAGRDSSDEHDILEIVQLSQMGFVGVWVWRGLDRWKRLGDGSTRRGKWLASLIFHPLALAPLLLGAIGLITIWFQLAAVNALEHKATALAASSIDNLSDSMTASLNARLATTGQEWAVDVNRKIDQTQQMLDNELFGEWVNTTTVVLNSTIVEFYAMVTDAVNVTFGGTVLEPPISTFLFCMIGSKIDAIEQALTWIHDHAHFTLPTVPADAFAISNATTAALVTPLAAAAVGGGDGNDDGPSVLQRLIDYYKYGLRSAQIVNGLFVGLWVLVVLCGVVAVVLDTRRERREHEGKPTRSVIDVVGSWPVFKVVGRHKNRGADGDDLAYGEKRRSSDGSWAARLPMAEKVGSLDEAFATPARPLPPAPRSPSHHFLSSAASLAPPRPASHVPADRTNSYFEFDGGAERSSAHPWLLRSTALRPDTGRPPSALHDDRAGWSSRLRGRMASLAAGLQSSSARAAGPAVALSTHDDDRSAPSNDPFGDNLSHLPIAQAYASVMGRLPTGDSPYPAPPRRYTAQSSPYHAIGSPRDLAHGPTPIFTQHHRPTSDPFADDGTGARTATTASGPALGKDPWRGPFDDPQL